MHLQPMIMLTCKIRGLIYMNGQMLGELRPEAPLLRPLSPFGACYLEFRPFEALCLPLAARIVFSSGRPVPASVTEAAGIAAISWPFGITEVELAPERIYTDAPVVRTLGCAGRIFRYVSNAKRAHLEIERAGGVCTHPLPEGAGEPLLAEGANALFASGKTADGKRYALALSESGEKALLTLIGDEITFLPNGRLLKTESVSDTAGHIKTQLYALSDGGYSLEEEQLLSGGAFQAITPAQAALSALECVQLGLMEEAQTRLAQGYAFPTDILSLVKGGASCAPLRFTPPDGRPAVSVIRRVSERLAEAAPIYYKAEIIGGEWKIISFEA